MLTLRDDRHDTGAEDTADGVEEQVINIGITKREDVLGDFNTHGCCDTGSNGREETLGTGIDARGKRHKQRDITQRVCPGGVPVVGAIEAIKAVSMLRTAWAAPLTSQGISTKGLPSVTIAITTTDKAITIPAEKDRGAVIACGGRVVVEIMVHLT